MKRLLRLMLVCVLVAAVSPAVAYVPVRSPSQT